MGSGDIITSRGGVFYKQDKANSSDDFHIRIKQAIAKYWHLVDRFVHKFSIKLVKTVRIPVYWGNPFSIRD